MTINFTIPKIWLAAILGVTATLMGAFFPDDLRGGWTFYAIAGGVLYGVALVLLVEWFRGID